MIFRDFFNECKKRGLFKNYTRDHIVYPAICGEEPYIYGEEDEYIIKLTQNYETFIVNFIKTRSILLNEQEKSIFNFNKLQL